MIKDIITTGPYLEVDRTYPGYVAAGGLSAGHIRWNTNTQEAEVYDGTLWVNVSTNYKVNLSNYAINALEWAHKKMREEQELLDKMEKHPTLKHAYEQFKTIEALVYEGKDA